MAQLDVQPKKKTSPWWLWLLVAIIIIAIILFFAKGCNNSVDKATASTHDSGNVAATGVTGAAADWNGINFNSPAASYDEITDSSIGVRGGDGYAIYSLGENVLFDTDKSTIRQEAESNLKQLAASLEKRFKGGEIRIYGHTDAKGSAGYNQQLAEQRAEAVKTWNSGCYPYSIDA